MRYTCQVEIAVPRARVLELMTDGDRAAEWMPGLVSYQAVEGERGQPGSVSELRFDGVPGSGQMYEKVTRRDDSHYDLVYLLGPVRNEALNTFTDVDGGTLWSAEHVFHLPPGMAEGMGPDGQKAFEQNTQKSMDTFRAWCEETAREANA